MSETPISNAELYARGLRYTALVARRTAPGKSAAAALRQVADDQGLDRATVRAAIRFVAAVDAIAHSAGPGSRKAILSGPRPIAPKLVMQISRTHPDRQRYAMAQIARGLSPFAKPSSGAPPFDTLHHGEVVSRLARATGLLHKVAVGLAGTPAASWPPAGTMAVIADHIAGIRDASATIRGVLSACDDEVGTTPARQDRGGRQTARTKVDPPPFNPEHALGHVASARGLVTKNARDLPRLLATDPPTVQDRAATLERLERLDVDATAVATLVESLGVTGAVPAPAPELSEATDDPDNRGGTYIVVFHLDADAKDVTVGALGTFDFPAGYYGYVGSAFGAGGVRARTARHCTPVKKKPKWNIDYLTPYTRAIEVWWTHDPIKRECSWSAVLAASLGFDCPALEFGARDCRKAPPLRIGPDLFRCQSHLYHSLERPRVQDFARRLGFQVPGHAPVRWRRLDRAEPGAGVAPDCPRANAPSLSEVERLATDGRPGRSTRSPGSSRRPDPQVPQSAGSDSDASHAIS